MGFRIESADEIEGTAFARQSDAQEVLAQISHLTDGFLSEDRPFYYSGDVYQVYKVIIKVELA